MAESWVSRDENSKIVDEESLQDEESSDESARPKPQINRKKPKMKMHWRKAKRLAEEQRQAELKARQAQTNQDPPPEKNLVISVPIPQPAEPRPDPIERINPVAAKPEEPQQVIKTFPPESRRLHSQLRASIDEQRELEYRQRENQMFKKKIAPLAPSSVETDYNTPLDVEKPGTAKKCMKQILNKKVIEGKKSESVSESPRVVTQHSDREPAAPLAVPKVEPQVSLMPIAQPASSSISAGFNSGLPPRVNLSKQRLLELQSKLMGTRPSTIVPPEEVGLKQEPAETMGRTLEQQARVPQFSAPIESSVFRDKTNETPSPSEESNLKQLAAAGAEPKADPMVILPPSPRKPQTAAGGTSEEEYRRKAKKKLTKIMHQSLGLRHNEPEQAASLIYDMLEGHPVAFIRGILCEVFENNPSAPELSGMGGVSLLCQRIQLEIAKRTPAN